MQLTIRCFAEPKHGQWQAFSLEFGLAAQADTYRAARSKLEAMIEEYLEDALGGQDREHADVLLSRKAAPSVHLYYHWKGFLMFLAGAFHKRDCSEKRVFREPWSLSPRHCSG
jgi:predicted RNase H-like HicB family nuclease